MLLVPTAVLKVCARVVWRSGQKTITISVPHLFSCMLCKRCWIFFSCLRRFSPTHLQIKWLIKFFSLCQWLHCPVFLLTRHSAYWALYKIRPYTFWSIQGALTLLSVTSQPHPVPLPSLVKVHVANVSVLYCSDFQNNFSIRNGLFKAASSILT